MFGLHKLRMNSVFDLAKDESSNLYSSVFYLFIHEYLFGEVDNINIQLTVACFFK